MEPWVTKTVECGTNHKYTNVHTFYSLKCYKYGIKHGSHKFFIVSTYGTEKLYYCRGLGNDSF